MYFECGSTFKSKRSKVCTYILELWVKYPKLRLLVPQFCWNWGPNQKVRMKKVHRKNKRTGDQIIFLTYIRPHRSFTLNFRFSFTCAFTAAYILSLNQVLLGESCKVIPSFTKSQTNLLTFWLPVKTWDWNLKHRFVGQTRAQRHDIFNFTVLLCNFARKLHLSGWCYHSTVLMLSNLLRALPIILSGLYLDTIDLSMVCVFKQQLWI
jgi:hypothetical protein